MFKLIHFSFQILFIDLIYFLADPTRPSSLNEFLNVCLIFNLSEKLSDKICKFYSSRVYEANTHVFYELFLFSAVFNNKCIQSYYYVG